MRLHVVTGGRGTRQAADPGAWPADDPRPGPGLCVHEAPGDNSYLVMLLRFTYGGVVFG